MDKFSGLAFGFFGFSLIWISMDKFFGLDLGFLALLYGYP